MTYDDCAPSHFDTDTEGRCLAMMQLDTEYEVDYDYDDMHDFEDMHMHAHEPVYDDMIGIDAYYAAMADGHEGEDGYDDFGDGYDDFEPEFEGHFNDGFEFEDEGGESDNGVHSGDHSNLQTNETFAC